MGQRFVHLSWVHAYGWVCCERILLGELSSCNCRIDLSRCYSLTLDTLSLSRARSVGRGWVLFWFRHSTTKAIVVFLPSYGVHVEMNMDSPLTTSLFVFPTPTTARQSNSVDVHGTSSHTTLAGVIRSVHIGMPPSFNNPTTPLEYIGHHIVVVNTSAATNATMLNVSLDSGMSPNTVPSVWGLGVVNQCVRASSVLLLVNKNQ